MGLWEVGDGEMGGAEIWTRRWASERCWMLEVGCWRRWHDSWLRIASISSLKHEPQDSSICAYAYDARAVDRASWDEDDFAELLAVQQAFDGVAGLRERVDPVDDRLQAAIGEAGA